MKRFVSFNLPIPDEGVAVRFNEGPKTLYGIILEIAFIDDLGGPGEFDFFRGLPSPPLPLVHAPIRP
ncbi:hypothetical protein I3843_01G151200 [Carya illinoinensis]|nr:hypothetical protein I3843_01G151200 [Carya illinoinensis]